MGEGVPLEYQRAAVTPVRRRYSVGRGEKGEVVVRVDAEEAAPGVLGMVVVGCVLVVVLGAIYFFVDRSWGWWAAAPLVGVGGIGGVGAMVRMWKLRRVYCFWADAKGLSVEWVDGRRRKRVWLARENVKDVRVGFAKARGGKVPGPGAWLTIRVRPWYRMEIRCLGHLGGDEVAGVADALREGLGMERRGWP